MVVRIKINIKIKTKLILIIIKIYYSPSERITYHHRRSVKSFNYTHSRLGCQPRVGTKVLFTLIYIVMDLRVAVLRFLCMSTFSMLKTLKI